MADKRKHTKYKLTLEWYTFKMVNASAKQWTNNHHVLLFLRLIYLQISPIDCIILTEEFLYNHMNGIWQT